MPVYIVQTSTKLNQKELDKALDLCQATNADTICVNAPKITDFKAYDFLLISNFTLYGRSTKGTKLDFVYSAPYKKAEEIYNYFIQEAKNNGRKN